MDARKIMNMASTIRRLATSGCADKTADTANAPKVRTSGSVTVRSTNDDRFTKAKTAMRR